MMYVHRDNGVYSCRVYSYHGDKDYLLASWFQEEMPFLHICAQFGYVDLLDWMCEKQGANPMAALMVFIRS